MEDETEIRDEIMYVTGIALSVSISLTESFACLRFMFMHLCTNESICIYSISPQHPEVSAVANIKRPQEGGTSSLHTTFTVTFSLFLW